MLTVLGINTAITLVMAAPLVFRIRKWNCYCSRRHKYWSVFLFNKKMIWPSERVILANHINTQGSLQDGD